MSHLATVEKALNRESLRQAEQGNYETARHYLGLAERTRSIQAEINDSPTSNEFQVELGARAPGNETAFPKFWVERDVLRKQGLSRDGKNTYVHGIPRAEFNSVLVRLKELAARQDEVVVRDFVTALKMPDYHPYIVLSVLEDLHLVESPKRGIIRFANRASFGNDADRAWAAVATRAAPER